MGQVTGEEDDETESTGGEDGEEPEDDATANEVRHRSPHLIHQTYSQMHSFRVVSVAADVQTSIH